MRITNNMMFDSSIRNLNNNLQRLSDAQTKYSTQSKIQVPSDDPVIATRAIKYRDYVADVEQYQKNTSDATSWMQVTDDALQGVADYVTRLKELITNGANDTNSATSKTAIADEIKEIRKGLVDTMNTSYAGRYVFAGYNTDEPPYGTKTISVTNAAGNTVSVEKVTYKNQYLNISGPVSASISDTEITNNIYTAANTGVYNPAGIKPNGSYRAVTQDISYHVSNGSEVKVNLEGQNVVGWSGDKDHGGYTDAGANIFDTIDKLLIGLNGESSYKVASYNTTTLAWEVKTLPSPATTSAALISSCLGDLETDLNRVTKAQSELGARMNYVESTDSRLGSNQLTYTKLLSSNEDIDVAQSSMEVSTAQSVYEGALAVTAKVTKASLVDYLR